MEIVAPQRVLITGDTHGNTEWVVRHVFKAAQRHNCQLVLQLGDFGIWPGPEGQRYQNAVDREAERCGIPVWFIDGNHEDFDQLYSLPLAEDGSRPVKENITHLPRGWRWTWGGKTFLAAGGATSLDVARRIMGRSWWPQEAITQADIDACVESGPTDVLITHDVQEEVRMRGGFDLRSVAPAVAVAAQQNRQALQIIVNATRPSLQIHGHWHEFHDTTVRRLIDSRDMRVVGLTADNLAGGGINHHCAVLDIDALARDTRNCLTVID